MLSISFCNLLLHSEMRGVSWCDLFHAFRSILCANTNIRNYPMCALSCFTVSDCLPPNRLQPTRLLCPWDFPSKNTGVGCCSLLQGIFQTEGSYPCFLHLLHYRWIIYLWATREALTIRDCNNKGQRLVKWTKKKKNDNNNLQFKESLLFSCLIALSQSLNFSES